MGKNKLAKWAELGTFKNVIQPAGRITNIEEHPVKGNWGKEIFGNDNPVTLELGCGKGEYTTGLSKIFPDRNFIGVDIKGARMWRGAKTASEDKSENVAFLRTRIEFIDSFFAGDEINEIWITFPDPHPAKRNSNKRLTCPWFLNKYRKFLKNNGIVHLKTDNADLYNYTHRVISGNGLDLLAATNDLYSAYDNDKTIFRNIYSVLSDPEADDILTGRILSIRTHYEQMFLEGGLKINYLAFRLEKEKNVEDRY